MRIERHGRRRKNIDARVATPIERHHLARCAVSLPVSRVDLNNLSAVARHRAWLATFSRSSARIGLHTQPTALARVFVDRG
jgi:hypothetical protein